MSRRRTGLAREGTFVLGVLVLLAVQPLVASDGSRYERTVTGLSQAAPQLRAGFADIALAQLAQAYLAEAGQARMEAQAMPDAAARLLSWSRGVERYASELLLVHEDAMRALPVEVRVLPMSDAAVTIAGRTVMLSHPRRDRQSTFEQTVLAAFCAIHDCLQLLASTSVIGPEPIPVRAIPRSADWFFTATGNVCAQQGVSLHFPPGGPLPRQRQLCAQLFAELQTLLVELRWQQRQGVVVDWPVISLAAATQRQQHLLTLNGAGDALLLNLPLLYQSQGLLAVLQPWLQASLAGSTVPELILPATDYTWGR